ncbi:MAG TPA: family 20 glycosylhydrolase [Bacteroidales bacterium]|nr:family 20 glycosylhydrolase [Bacteroidales bacterium]
MSTIVRFLQLIIVVTFLISCDNDSGLSDNCNDLSVIPEPVSTNLNSGEFELKENTIIYHNKKEISPLAEYLAEKINIESGFELKIKEGKGKGINLQVREDLESTLGSEGYKLTVEPRDIVISAARSGGLFYGIQTLLQMIPVENEDCDECKEDEIEIQCAEIEDYPRFKWRGLLLDVSRHFFTIDEVKSLIDEMAQYKYNVLQLHLTDDQGWRIEIKSMPELTATGAWRVPRTGLWWDRECPQEGEAPTYGGFYTQDQIRDLVEYAAFRNVNILPEIEAPGHSLAAIAAYPYLSSTGLKYKVNPGCKFYTIDDNSICAGKETSYEYMEKVLSEVAALFPFEYIHIGGDECYKGFWKKCPDCQKLMKENGLKNENELQSYFIKRLEKIIEAKGKKLIGWDEILEGGLAPNAAVMSWRGMQGGITAAKAQHHVVMSPVDYAYLDFYQGDPAIEPPTYAMLRLKKVYEFEPVPEGVEAEYILGGQGNLWTESVPTFRHAEYMLWPRAFALAEVLWSPKDSRDWNRFVKRTEEEMKRLEKEDVNYARSFYDAIITATRDDRGNLLIGLGSELDGVNIYYSFDNTYPDDHSSLYKSGEKLSVPKDADTFRVITYRDGKPAGRIITIPLAELMKRIS